jgi:hypothetical protein
MTFLLKIKICASSDPHENNIRYCLRLRACVRPNGVPNEKCKWSWHFQIVAIYEAKIISLLSTHPVHPACSFSGLIYRILRNSSTRKNSSTCRNSSTEEARGWNNSSTRRNRSTCATIFCARQNHASTEIALVTVLKAREEAEVARRAHVFSLAYDMNEPWYEWSYINIRFDLNDPWWISIFVIKIFAHWQVEIIVAHAKIVAQG